MIFFQNYANSQYEKYLNSFDGYVSIDTMNPTYGIDNIIDFINKNNVFNPTNYIKDNLNNSDYNISINFVDFSISSDNFFEHYDSQNKSITITEKVLALNSLQLSSNDDFTNYIISNLKDDSVNYILTHEMAHGIQHYIFENTQSHLIEPINNNQVEKGFFSHLTAIRNHASNFNPCNLSKQEIKNYDIFNSIDQSINEGFADLYSCLVHLSLYDDKERTINFATIIKEGRENFSYNYFNSEVIDYFINDLKDNSESLKFKSFEDLGKYMTEKINLNTQNVLIQKLSGDIPSYLDENIQKDYNSYFLGAISSVYNLGDDSKEVLNQLLANQKELPKSLNFNNSNHFLTGKTEFKNHNNFANKYLENNIKLLQYQSNINDYSKKSKFKKNLISDSLNGNSIHDNIKQNTHENNDFTITNKTRKKDGLGY